MALILQFGKYIADDLSCNGGSECPVANPSIQGAQPHGIVFRNPRNYPLQGNGSEAYPPSTGLNVRTIHIPAGALKCLQAALNAAGPGSQISGPPAAFNQSGGEGDPMANGVVDDYNYYVRAANRVSYGVDIRVFTSGAACQIANGPYRLLAQ